MLVSPHSANRHRYMACVSVRAVQRDLHISITSETLKLLSPLDEQNTIVPDEVIQAECFQLLRSINPIEIDMVEVRIGTVVLVNQREGGTGHILLVGSLKGLCYPLHERGLTCAQVSTQQDEFWGLKYVPQTPPKCDRFVFGVGDNFLDEHRQSSIARLR